MELDEVMLGMALVDGQEIPESRTGREKRAWIFPERRCVPLIQTTRHRNDHKEPKKVGLNEQESGEKDGRLYLHPRKLGHVEW